MRVWLQFINEYAQLAITSFECDINDHFHIGLEQDIISTVFLIG